MRDYNEFRVLPFTLRFLRPGCLDGALRSRTYASVQEVLERWDGTIKQHVKLQEQHKELVALLHQKTPEAFGEMGFSDLLALYTMLKRYQPERVLEIGSGASTWWIRHALPCTDFIVVDPAVRETYVKDCASTLVPEHFEDVWDKLPPLFPGDLLFYDGSHLVVPGSDAVVLYLEYIPRLPKDVLIQVHDCFAPDDVPEAARKALQLESYLTYMMLVYGNFEVLLPVWALSHDGGSLWVRTR